MNQTVVVIGGGVAGMAAAGKLQRFGFKVTLVEKAPELGGHVKNWFKVFPDLTDASEILDNLKTELPGVRVLTETTVDKITGDSPNFSVHLSSGETIATNSILVSTGFHHFDASFKEEYGYGLYDNVITAVELDAMLKAERLHTTKGQPPKKVAIIHCVGSRDQKVDNNYCSRVCCTNGIKDAIEIKQLIPDCTIYNMYMDIRVFGRGYEELYRTSQEQYGIQFIRGRLSEASERPDGTLYLRVEDTLTAKPIRLTVDMIVLLVGMEGNNDLAEVAGLQIGCDRFYVTANQQYCNNASPRPGIFLAGAATGPKAIMESITDGRSAASEILAFAVQQQALAHSNGHHATAEQSAEQLAELTEHSAELVTR